MNRNKYGQPLLGSQPQSYGLEARPWMVRSGNPLQQAAAAARPAAQHPAGRPAPAPASRAAPPASRFPFSQPQGSSQIQLSQGVASQSQAPVQSTRPALNLRFMPRAALSQPVPGLMPWSQPSHSNLLQDQHMGDNMEDCHNSAPAPDARLLSQEASGSMHPVNTAAKLLSQIQRQQTFSLDESFKADVISKRVGALDSKVDVLSADLASQGAKLDSLENTCKDVIQALRVVADNTSSMQKQLALLASPRRPVMTEVGVQTSPSLAELPSGVRRPAGASPDSKLEYGQAAKQPSPAAAANKPTLAPGTQQGAKGRPSSAMQPQSSKPPARQPTRRVTRQSSTAAAALAAASAGQPSKGATSSKAGAPVVSFSRKRNQPPQQQEDAVQQPSPKRRQATQQPAAQAPAPPVSMFDLLFGGATAEEPQQKQPHRPVAQREAEPLGAAQDESEDEDVMRQVKARMDRHRKRLSRKRSGVAMRAEN